MRKILIITTSAAHIGPQRQATGFHYEELTTPYYAFCDNDYAVDIASPLGGKPPHDPNSLKDKDNPESVDRFLEDSHAMAKLNNSLKLSELDLSFYKAIYFPGGHGAMVDLPEDEVLARKLGHAYDKGVIIAAVCHGPAALLKAHNKQGEPIVSGKRVNSFSNSEEEQIHYTDIVPFLLEDKLKDLGAHYECGPNFSCYTVRDGQIITGQNLKSAFKLAELILEAIDS